MIDRRHSRVIGSFTRAHCLRGASSLALLAAGLAATAPAAAQVGPGSPQCPVVADVVTCSGSLPGGIDVPSGPYDGLDVSNVTGDMVAANRSVIRYVAGRPNTVIRITDPDSVIRLTATAALPNATQQSELGAIDVTAVNSTSFSLTNDVDIVTAGQPSSGPTVRYIPVAILVRGSGGAFSIANAGDINMTQPGGGPGGAAIKSLVTGATLVALRNSGVLTLSNQTAGIVASLDNGRVELTNDGSIAMSGGPASRAIDLVSASATAGRSYSVVNNGLIDMVLPGQQLSEVIHVSTAGMGSGEIVNNGTLRAQFDGGNLFGISVTDPATPSITNNGLIDLRSGNLNGGPIGIFAATGLITNGAAGTISVSAGTSVGNATGIVTGPAGNVSNAGLITATAFRAVGIAVSGSGAASPAGQVANSGTIRADGGDAAGVEGRTTFSAAGQTSTMTVTNSGTVEGVGAGAEGMSFTYLRCGACAAGIELQGRTIVNLASTSIVRGGSGSGAGIIFAGGERHSLVNAGLITALSGNAVIGGAGAETVDNGGRIEGSVSLGAGDDRVVARDGGVITGALDGGTGSDVLQLDVATGAALFTDRIAGAVSGFELLEKSGAGTLSLAQPVVPRVALLGGTLATSGDLSAMRVDAGAGTILAGAGRLGAVTLASGAILSPGGGAVGTLELASLLLAADSRLRFDLGAPGIAGGAENDLISVTGNLTLDGLLDINARPNFGNGVYRLINYGGALTDNGLVIGSAPATAYQVQTSIAGQVNLVVGTVSIQFWDGGDTAPDGAVDGGNGTWNATGTNWTRVNGDVNESWGSQFAVFQGTAGTVTIAAGGVTATGLQFAVDGYRIEGGQLTLLAPATLRVGDGSAGGAGYTATVASVIAGAGGIDKTDLGTLVLAGTNLYSGGTRVGGGVLQVGGDGNLGAAAGGVTLDGGTLRFSAAATSARAFTIGASGGAIDAANALTLSGAIGGAGALTKTGAGTLTLSGNSSGFAGTVNVAGGILNVTGSLGGTLVVQNGGRLLGTGTLGNLTIASGGTLAPGGSIGTLNISGNATFRAGSIYELEIGSAGGGDRIAVGGTATIEGGTVRVVALDPETQYVAGTRYTFLTAAGGRTGTFTSLSENSAFLDFALGYDANSAFLTVSVVRTFPNVAQSFNQIGASTALAAFGQAAGSDSLAVYNELLLADVGGARAAFDAASGEIYAALLASGLRHGAGRADRLLGRSRELAGEGWGLWGSANGATGHVDGDGNGARFSHDGIGGELGIDYRGPGNGWALGVGGGYDERGLDLRGRASHAEAEGWHLGGYARYGSGGQGFTATLSGAYATGEAEVARTIAIGAISRIATARVDSDSWSLGGEIRYGLALGGGWAAGPQLDLAHAGAGLGRFAEAGAASLDLSGGAGNHVHRTLYGAGLFARWAGIHGAIDVTAAYRHGGAAPAEIGLLMAGAPGTAYRVRAARGDGDMLRLALSGELGLGGGWSLGGNVAGAYGNREGNFQGRALKTEFRYVLGSAPRMGGSRQALIGP